jgi:hypothetical protein
MGDARFIHAIEVAARATGLVLEHVCDPPNPDSIAVLLGVHGADGYLEPCLFRRSLVINWVQTFDEDGQRHLAGRIETAKNLIREHYRHTGRNPFT